MNKRELTDAATAADDAAGELMTAVHKLRIGLRNRVVRDLPVDLISKAATAFYLVARYGEAQAEAMRRPAPASAARDAWEDVYAYLWGAIAEIDVGDACAMGEPVELPNRYWGDPDRSEPWYQVRLGGGMLTVGPRKRVVVVLFEAEIPFCAAGARLVAADLGATYFENGCLSRGDVHPENTLCKSVLQHIYKGPTLKTNLLRCVRAMVLDRTISDMEAGV